MRQQRVLVIALAALVTLSCQTTRLIDTWTPKDYEGTPYERLMVVGLSPNPGGRDRYENAFVDKLTNYGVLSVASINVVPEVEDIDRETVESWLSEFTLHGVLVTRVNTTEPGRHYAPPHTSLAGWYNSWMQESSRAPSGEKFYLEADLFDAKTEELVYSGVVETKIKDDAMETIHTVIDKLATDMVERGYFKGR